MPKTGDRIKHYEIEKLLGKGGMGEVYLAKDTKLDRKVAIKFLPPDLETDEHTQARFIREAKAAAALDHPFICKVYESGKTDGKSYIVMEYLEGQNLQERMKSKPLSLNESLKIALEISESLEKAHKEGIIHRDLKPSNIMITPQEHIKVMDFGLAKKFLPSGGDLERTLTQASITEEGTIAGTLAYMSPEQAKGKKLDGRSDIFSLGIIIYEMFSHKHPFSKTTPIETLSAILRDLPPMPNVRPKTINPFLRPILKKALAKDPDDRYQNISELISDLRKAQRQAQGSTRLPLQGIPLFIVSASLVAVIATGVFFLAKRPAATPKAQPAPISVLIADFENNTGDTIFDGALEQLFGIKLEGASFITTYNRHEARKLVNQLYPGATDRLNFERAQLLCGREGINVLIGASIDLTDDGYILKANALDPVNDEIISNPSRTVKSKDGVLKAAELLAGELRADLGGAPLDSTEALEKETSTSSSLKAWKAYNKAQELDAQGKQYDAIAEYLKAIQEDPGFGRAYSGLAMIYYNQGEQQKAEEYHAKALANIDSMSVREKYRTRIVFYFLSQDYQKVVDEAIALVEQFPSDSAGYGNLSVGYFMLRKFPKALEFGKKQVELVPNHVNAHNNVSWFAMGTGNFELAEDEAKRTLELDSSREEAYVSLALSFHARNMLPQATSQYGKLMAQSFWGESLGTIGLTDIALYEGRLNDARDLLDKGINRDLDNKRQDLAAIKAVMLSYTYLLLGEEDMALKLSDQAYAVSQRAHIAVPISAIYLETGNVDKAISLAEELSKRLEAAPRAHAKLIEGEISRKNGNIPGAIEHFNESRRLLDTWLVHLSLGKAYLDGKAFTNAQSEFETCLKRQGEATTVFANDIPSYYYFPQIHYYMGLALEGMGSAAAKDSYTAFLTIKDKADGDWMVEDARKRLNNL